MVSNCLFELRANLSGLYFRVIRSDYLFLVRHKRCLSVSISTARYEEGDTKNSCEYFFHDVECLFTKKPFRVIR